MKNMKTLLEKYFKNHFDVSAELNPFPHQRLEKLPLYLRKTYQFFIGLVLNREIIFALKKDGDDFTISQYKTQAEIIERILNQTVVFSFSNIAAYNRKRLIEKKIAFIVPGKQFYVPKLFLDFKEHKQIHSTTKEKLFPAAQCLFLYVMLNHESDILNFQQLAEKLKFGKMTITRAASVLRDLNLCKINGTKNKSLLIERKKETWFEALPYLIDPVAKEIGIEAEVNDSEIFISGYKALAHYTNLEDATPIIYTGTKTTYERLVDKMEMIIHEGKVSEYFFQVWKYDPGVLTATRFVDPLSLYLANKYNHDESVESEFNKLLERLW